MRQIWIKAPHLEKGGTLGQSRYTQENAAQLEKCATLKKMRHTWINAPHLRK